MFLGLALVLVGGVCIVAGVEGRGAQLFTTVTGKAALGATSGTSSSGSAPAGFAPAGGGTGAGVTYA